MPTSEPQEGIWFNMPSDVYHDAPGLSHSGMKALSESPLVYWHRFIAKHADEPSAAARFGSLVHCRLLEPKRFSETWAVPPSIEGYPGAMTTIEHLVAWLKERGLKTTYKVKADLIQRIAETGEEAVVWDAIMDDWRKAKGTKGELSQSEADRIRDISSIVHADSTASKLLSGGYPEVSIFVRDPETGVLYKSRLDWMKTAATLDVKTFTRYRGQSPKDAINRAFWFEGYHRQGVFYHRVRDLARRRLSEGTIRVHGDVPTDWLAEFAEADDHAFAFLFIEQDAPHHMDCVKLQRTSGVFGDLRAYWGEAERWIDEHIRRYRVAVDAFGDQPWRSSLNGRTLQDDDMPQLAYAKERFCEQAEV